ncbi:MAG: hypothetical protein WC091_20385 [Sulfuricellaceae bacterium]
MKLALSLCHVLLVACCAATFSAQAQDVTSPPAQNTINLSQTSYVPVGTMVLIRNIQGPDGRYYDAKFNWDTATNSLMADLSSLAVSTAVPPTCGAQLLYEVGLNNDGFTTPVTKSAHIEFGLTGDLNQRKLYLTFSLAGENNGYLPEVRPYFFPERLRLVQNGVTHGVNNISNNAAPHFVPDNNWQPHLTAITDNNAFQGTITNIPASFDLGKPFYVYYGKGTPGTPATDGTDSYFLCGG